MVRIGLLGLALLFSAPAFCLSVGDTAPQIIGRDISNQLFALSQMDTKPKVLNFFWVNCKPCEQEMPLLAKKELDHPEVSFAAIHAELNTDTDTNYDIKDIQSFAKSLKAHPKTMVLGSEQLKRQYGVVGFPVSFLLTADNKIEKVLYGFNEKTVQQLENWLGKQK